MKPKIQKQIFPAAFTLIELLVVISIIGVLTAFIIGGLKAAKRIQYQKTAKAELKFIEAAIENYNSKYNSYPPSNQNPADGSATPPYDPLIYNQLYYELSGVTHNTSAQTYTTLDGLTTIKEADYKTAFGVDGIINVSRGSGEDGVAARNFLTGLKQRQSNDQVTNKNVRTTALVTSVGGPDDAYQPMNFAGLNPVHYNSANPTNNPSSYDLWIDLVFGGKTNRISNWSAK